MFLLTLGVLAWVTVHLFPSVAPGARSRLISLIGEGSYKLGFSLLIVAALILIVLGWRDTAPTQLYGPPAWGRMVTAVLMLIALILFVSASMSTNIKHFIRHPQLTGVIVWAIAHLIANGDSRSLILFGGLGVWALVEMPLINRREGPWQRPALRPLTGDIKPVGIGMVAFVVIMVLHPTLFGASAKPY